MIISTHSHFSGPPLVCTIHLNGLSAGARDAAVQSEPAWSDSLSLGSCYLLVTHQSNQ